MTIGKLLKKDGLLATVVVLIAVNVAAGLIIREVERRTKEQA